MTIELTIRLNPELADRLEGLARDMGRDPAEVAAMAIDAYIDANAWQVRHIREALDGAKSGSPGVPHDEVVAWIKSWGTGHELPRPVPKQP
jgi:predicted transcriptional regulator